MQRFVVGLLCLACAPGCSYLFVESVPPNYAEKPHLDCTSGKAAPVLDTLGAGFEVVRTGIALAASDSQYSGYPISREADILLGLSFATLFTASAIYGYSNTAACTDAKEHAQTMTRFEATPMYTPPAPTFGCTVDTQCKGDRVCDHGQCIEPRPMLPMPPPPPAMPAPPADAAAPATPPSAATAPTTAPVAPAPTPVAPAAPAPAPVAPAAPAAH